MKYLIAPELIALLRKELAEGKYPAGSKFPSEYELSERFSINKTTANKVVTALVNAGLLARSVRGGGTRVLQEEPFPKGQIAFLGTVKANYSSEVLKGATDCALLKKYVITLLNPPPQYLQHYLDMFKSMPFRGILTMAYGPVRTPEGIPVIHINQEFPDSDAVHHAVNSDNYGGAHRMMEKILEAGHREIAFFLTDVIGWNSGERNRAFTAILREAGIPHWKERFFYGGNGEPRSAEHVLPQILERFPNITAIVTENDNDALFMLSEIQLRGAALRKQIVVTGFGGLAYLSARMEFATVDQQLERLGQVAAEKLIQMIEDGPPEKPFRARVETRLLNLECLRRFSGRPEKH
ncbi:MAG: HTH-type transcriptional regulator AscG [Lentisphaerae bacterium ADurb.Bin242]|nr:MAG: HTH-type transcriptional regulator AscG [Lentisphaerae bacterium ADurb.Bin242]